MPNTDTQEAFRLDKQQIRRAFDRAADSYDAYAKLQDEVGSRMLSRLDYINIEPQSVIDIGCGTGRITKQLSQRYENSRVIAFDIAEGMLQKSKQLYAKGFKQFFDRDSKRIQHLCGDAESLPLIDNSLGFVFSNVTFQWCNNLDKALQDCYRVLAPGSLILFSSFGPDTLKELRNVWQEVDNYNHVNAFMDMHDVGDALVRSGFQSPVLDVEQFTLTYDTLKDLMKELKAIGAHNVTAGRARGLTGRKRLAKITEAYEQYRHGGRLPASYEVIYGHAWVPEQKTRKEEDNIEVKISLKQLGQR